MRKKNDGIQELFITYANLPLTGKPALLKDLHAEIIKYLKFSSEDSRNALGHQIELIIKLANDRNYAKWNDIKASVPLLNAFLFVYGDSESGDCSGSCFLSMEKRRMLGDQYYRDQQRVKCYECEQEYFRHIIREITDSKEYSEIIGFAPFIAGSRDVIKKAPIIIQNRKKVRFKEILDDSLMWNPIPGLLSYSIFLRAMIAYSLGVFLINSDRQKLKCCPICQKFFIARDTKRKICYELACKNEYHRRDMENRRREDPVRYC